MAAYVIFQIGDSRDPEALQRYRIAAKPNIIAAGGKIIVARGKQTVVEGKAPKETVIVEFETADQALAWYHSDAYQEICKLRHHAADVDAYVVEGLAPPK